jgi:uncharacterized protein YdaU (DUF1376 family)
MPSKADIWMPLYIGDILADTSHLDAERFGCYMLWLMHYWRKGPLSGNLADLVGIGKLRCADAPSIAQALLSEFFTLNGDGRWHQKRSDLEIAKWQDKSLKAQEKAKTAAEARWGKDAPSNPPSNAQAMPTLCPLPSPSPLPSLPPLTPPSAPEKKDKKQKTPARSVSDEDLAGTLPLVNGSEYRISKQDVKTWIDTFPGVEIKAELKKFKAWLNANPTRRKTERGINRAIFSWLEKEQNSSRTGRNGGNHATLLDGKGGHNLVLYNEFDREEEYSGCTIENGYVPGN